MSNKQGFIVWVTGLPASGKSSISRILAALLRDRSVPVVVLESDEMRKILTPLPTYEQEERDLFYRTLTATAGLIAGNGVNVIIDATANRRSYRDHARSLFPRFVEVYVQCPLNVCMQRDPKGIYQQALIGKNTTVPGLQSDYEPPLNPEITLDCKMPSDSSASRILDKLKQLLYI